MMVEHLRRPDLGGLRSGQAWPAFLRPLAPWLLLTHAFASTIVVAAVGLFLLVIPAQPVPAGRFAMLLATMAVAQVSIGAINEWADRYDDAISKPWRPLPSGRIAPLTALMVGIVSGLASAALAATIHRQLLLLTLIGLTAGHSYNLALKRTPLSWLPYLVALPLVPIWSGVGAASFDGRLGWLYLIGLPATIHIHLANVLPDISADERVGHTALAQLLGRERAVQLCWGCSVATPVLGLGSAWLLGALSTALWAGLAGYLLALLAAAFIWRRNRRQGVYWLFRLLAPATAMLGVGWVAGL